VLIFGVLLLFGSLGCGVLLALEQRDVLVQAQVGHVEWTGHLYAAVIVGALLACWFMLGVAFIRCRLAERRRGAASRSRALTRPGTAVGYRSQTPPTATTAAPRSTSAAKTPVGAIAPPAPEVRRSTTMTTRRVADRRGR